MRQAQAAIEFLMLAGFVVFVFSGFFVVIQNRVQEQEREVLTGEASAVADAIRREVQLAANAYPGYSRTFQLPKLIADTPYAIDALPASGPSEIIITHGGGEEYVVFLPVNLSSGSAISPGENRIRKPEAGRIIVAPPE